MGELKDLAKKIRLVQKETTLGQEFERHYYKTVLLEHPPREPKEDMFSPSSLNKCSREIFYRVNAYKPEPKTGTPEHLLGSWAAITDNGSDRHEHIQNTIAYMYNSGMDIEWLDVGRYVYAHPELKTEIVEKQGMETKLYNPLISARFLCDGLVRIKDKLYIVEIKTMNSRKYAKAEQKGSMLDEHIEQATAYSIALGVNDVLYIYENRDNSQIRVYERHILDLHKQALINKIYTIQTYKQNNQIPPKTEDISKCTYCEYKNRCAKDGYTPNLFPTLQVTIDE